MGHLRLLSRQLGQADIERICEEGSHEVASEEQGDSCGHVALHLVVVELVEEVAEFSVSFGTLALRPSHGAAFLHEVYDLRHAVFLERFVAHLGCSVVEREEEGPKAAVARHQRKPAYLCCLRQLPDR